MGGSEMLDALVAAAATASPAPSSRVPPSAMSAAAFVSPEPVAVPSREKVLQHTLSAGSRKKLSAKVSGQQQQQQQPPLKRKAHRELELSAKKSDPARVTSSATDGSVKRKKLDMSSKRHQSGMKASTSKDRLKAPKILRDGVESATRKLEFAMTPQKEPKALKDALPGQRNASSTSTASSSSSSSSDDDEHSSASSDECEVTFDAMTLGNMRPNGLEYHFSVASTVSSIAVAPNGKFLVVGFVNGT
ncbi:hypothetical protein ATCC90586_003385 [Pythium insidiosum]|nr:hypothetical protein ATCC90586_003385 [Pythium insidiosum]